MLIDITNKVAYNEISANVAEFFSSNGNEVALTNRALNYDENGELDISNITADEKSAGVSALVSAMSAEQMAKYAENTSDLNAAKTIKLAEISAKFNASLDNNGGIEVAGVGVVNAGERHLKNCQDMLKVIGDGEIDFRLFNNSFIKVNKSQLERVEIALIQAGLAGYAKKWELEQSVANAKSKSALEKIKVKF